jgi:hypothetical protein
MYSLTSKQWFIIILAVCALPFSIGYSIYISLNKENWKSSGGTPDEKNTREKNRGTLVSIIGAVMLSFVMMLMTNVWNLDKSLVKFRYGFILGPIIGYMLDRGIGSDTGLKHPFTFAFSSLYNWEFLRYLMTVLVDVFISDPILDGLKVYFGQDMLDLSNRSYWLFKLIGNNAMNILQSLVGFVTFQAYTNQTRFNWAYAPPELPMNERYRGITIILLSAVSSVVYLSADIKGANSNTVSSKMPVVLFAFGLLTLLAQYDELDGKVCENNECNVESSPTTIGTAIGVVIFSIFAMYGFGSPFFSKAKGNNLGNYQKLENNNNVMYTFV